MKNNERMNKKILLGCIGAVMIIMSASFTSVIGEQTRNSSEIPNSPLFHIRTLRVTDNQNGEAITTDYIGKGKTITLSLSTHSNTRLLFRKAIESISKIDEPSFDKFLETAVIKLREHEIVKEEEIPKLVELFHFLRKNPDVVKIYPVVESESKQLILWTAGCQTVNCYTLQETPILCLILIVTFPIWFPILLLYNLYLNFKYSRPTVASFGCP